MSSHRIHALPLHLANQIAAGEVVERPASVLKELVENSFDAGATQIDITIAGAGKELIKVSDNGSGIHQDDLLLALSRHATSKLHSSEQLSQISSLGFRGEALPSIASVSQLKLTSRFIQSPHAWELSNDSEDLRPAAHPQGTTISVAELFFNLPARRRFLRSDKTELHQLMTTLNRLALSRFDVGFNCDWGNQQTLRLPALHTAEHYPQRLLKICGKSFIHASLYLQQQFEQIRISGWIAKPDAHRAQTDVQYFFINGRVIRDRVINHAIRQAYGKFLPDGRQAAYVLYLELPLDKVDVNVHPTKHEVRFREGRLIHGLITQAITDALESKSGHEEKTITAELDIPPTPPQINEVAEQYQIPVFSKDTSNHLKLSAKPSTQPQLITGRLQLLHQRFALIQTGQPQLIDLCLAEQQLKQQQLRTAIANGNLASRQILVPVSYECPAPVLQRFKQHQSLLEQFAISLSIRNTSVTIQRIPYLLAQVDLQAFIKHITDALMANEETEKVLSDTLINLVPTRPITSISQAEQILESLTEQQLDNTQFCRTLDSATLSGLFSD